MNFEIPDSIKPLKPQPSAALPAFSIPDSILPLSSSRPGLGTNILSPILGIGDKIKQALAAAAAATPGILEDFQPPTDRAKIAEEIRNLAPDVFEDQPFPVPARGARWTAAGSDLRAPVSVLTAETPDPETIARMAALEQGKLPPFKVPDPLLYSAREVLGSLKEAGASTLSGFYGSAANTAALLHDAANWMGGKISKLTGIPEEKLTGGAFNLLAENWATISADMRKAGVKTPVVKDIWEAMGAAGWDVPEIMAFGQWGLPIHGAIKGGLEEGPAGSVKGAITGTIAHSFLKGVAPLAEKIRLPSIFAFGAATGGPDFKDRLVGGLTFTALGIKGHGKEVLRVSDFIDAYPKLRDKIETGRAWDIVRKIEPSLTRADVKGAGGPQALLDRWFGRIKEQVKTTAGPEKESAKVVPPVPAGTASPAGEIPAFMAPPGFNRFGEGKFKNVNRFLERMGPLADQGWVIRYDIPDKTGRVVFAKIIDKKSPGDGSLSRTELDLKTFKVRTEQMKKVADQRKTPLTNMPMINAIRKLGGISLELAEKSGESGELQDLLERKDLPAGLIRKKGGGRSPSEISQILASGKDRFLPEEAADRIDDLVAAIKGELEGKPRFRLGQEPEPPQPKAGSPEAKILDQAQSLAFKAFEDGRESELSDQERSLVDKVMAELETKASGGNEAAKESLVDIENRRAISLKRNELLKATGKSVADIEEFLSNTFLDGEEAKGIARSVIKGEMPLADAVRELQEFIDSAVGKEPPKPAAVPEEKTFTLKGEEIPKPEPKTGKLFTPETAGKREPTASYKVKSIRDFQAAAAEAKSSAADGWEVEYGTTDDGWFYVRRIKKSEPGKGTLAWKGRPIKEFLEPAPKPQPAGLDLEAEQGKLAEKPAAFMKETVPRIEEPKRAGARKKGRKPPEETPGGMQPTVPVETPPPPAPAREIDETVRAIGEKLQKGKELKPEEWAYLKAHGIGEELPAPDKVQKAEVPEEKPSAQVEPPGTESKPAAIPKGKMNLVRISITDPTGDTNVFELPEENAAKVMPRLKKLAGSAVQAGRPFVGRWKNYVSPAEAERDVVDFAREVKETSKEKWKEWNSKPVEDVVEDVIAGRERDRPSTPRGTIGLTVAMVPGAEIPKKPEEPYRFTEPGEGISPMEEAYQRAHGIKEEPFVAKVKAAVLDVIHKSTRTYEDLPSTGEFAKAKTWLKILEKQKPVAADKAIRSLVAVLYPLSKEEGNVFSRKVLLEDLNRMAERGQELPSGFTHERIDKALDELGDIIHENPAIEKSLKARRTIWDPLGKNYVVAMAKIGKDVSYILKNPDYFRHQVLEYATGRGVFGPGERLRGIESRSFLAKRSGEYTGDINTKYVEAEFEVMAQLFHDIEVAKTRAAIQGEYDIMPKLREQARLINEGLDADLEAGRITSAEHKARVTSWEKFMPKGYETLAVDELETYFKTYAIPQAMSDQLLKGLADELTITVDNLKEIVARGPDKFPWVVKRELAATLRKIAKPASQGEAAQFAESVQRAWKHWTLTAPHKVFKYNIRNAIGDIDKVVVGNLDTFRFVPRAYREVVNLFYGKKELSPEIREWFNRGGVESLLQVQELPEIKRFRQFERFEDLDLGDRIKSFWRNLAAQPKKFTNARESVLRYASFLSYIDQMKKDPGGRPKNFGGSIPEEVLALDNVHDRAWRLSNELLGAYDEISITGQALRKYGVPFWSFQEANFRTYVRIFKNVGYDNTSARKIGTKILAGVKHTPFMALKVGRLAIKALGLVAVTAAFNNLRHRDEEKDLSPNVKDTVHVILGRDKDGKVLYFNRLGTLQDFLEWGGLDAAPRHIMELYQGKKTVKEIALEMATSPVNKMIQTISPFIKAPFELISRKAFFPDIKNPRLIRDRWRHVASIWGLEDVYDKVFDRPSQPIESGLIPKMFYYKSDPLEVAYHETANTKSDWLKKYGKKGIGFSLTPRSEALYNMRLAHRYGDKDQEEKYFKEYLHYQVLEGQDLGKTRTEIAENVRRGLRATFQNMHPLAGLSQDERLGFVKSLNEDERVLLGRALQYYLEVLIGGNTDYVADESGGLEPVEKEK